MNSSRISKKYAPTSARSYKYVRISIFDKRNDKTVSLWYVIGNVFRERGTGQMVCWGHNNWYWSVAVMARCENNGAK